jgi:dimethylhistidine N-methyltransferase
MSFGEQAAATGRPAEAPALVEVVREGLSDPAQKWLPASLLYDELGSALFDAITLLPEYGLTRADQRVLTRAAAELPHLAPNLGLAVELGSGSGSKTRPLLESLGWPEYVAIDVSRAALGRCKRDLALSDRQAHFLEMSYLDGLAAARNLHSSPGRRLVLFLGSTIGNFRPAERTEFLRQVRQLLNPADLLLIGFDLVKPAEQLLPAYDDPIGLTAAFNRNVLGRLNRELGADFPLQEFAHEARWNSGERRIEMHLRCRQRRRVSIPGASLVVEMAPEETIWTESSYKFLPEELPKLAEQAGFRQVAEWEDRQWPFVEALWLAG